MSDDKTVLRRIHLHPLIARKLDVAAALRGISISDFIAGAIDPYLAFDLPELPDVEIRSTLPELPPGMPRAGQGRARLAARPDAQARGGRSCTRRNVG